MHSLSNPWCKELSPLQLDNRGQFVQRIGYSIELIVDFQDHKKGEIIHLLPMYNSYGTIVSVGQEVSFNPISGPHGRVVRWIQGYSSSKYHDSNEFHKED